MWKAKDFLRQKPEIINHFKKKGVTSNSMSEFCTMAGVPIVIACEFVKEGLPEHTEFCDNKIAELKEFYGIKE